MKTNWAELTRLIICALLNIAFVYCELAGIEYSQLFVAALTASWGVLGLEGYSHAMAMKALSEKLRSEGKTKGNWTQVSPSREARDDNPGA